MPFTVTDDTCGHNVLVATTHQHAADQARLADLAGYPTTLEEWETPPDHPTVGPPTPPACVRCWDRVADTLHVMNRGRVAAAAEEAAVDPFAAVYAYDRLLTKRPDLTSTEAARLVAAARWTYLQKVSPLDPFNADTLEPSMFTEPSSHGPT
jgi:hypothetical protein